MHLSGLTAEDVPWPHRKPPATIVDMTMPAAQNREPEVDIEYRPSARRIFGTQELHVAEVCPPGELQALAIVQSAHGSKRRLADARCRARTPSPSSRHG